MAKQSAPPTSLRDWSANDSGELRAVWHDLRPDALIRNHAAVAPARPSRAS